MKKGKWFSITSAVAVTAMLVAGCGSANTAGTKNGSGKQVTLKFWGWMGAQSPEKAKFLDPAIADFNAHNSYNAKIEYMPIPQDQYNMKITTEVAANNVPDLFMVHEAGFLSPFVKQGKVAAENDLLGNDVINSFVPGIFNTVTFNSKIYAMPLTETSQMVFYNKEIFAKYNLTPPKTFADLIKISKTLSSHGVTPFALGNKDVWTGGLFINTMAYRHGGKQLFDDLASGKQKFSDKTMVQAAEDFSNLVKAGAFSKEANSENNDQSRQDFLSGKAAMWLNGSWEISTFTSKQQSNGTNNPLYGKVGFFNWTSVDGGVNDENAWILAPDYNVSIAANSPNKKAAAAFLKVLASPKYQNILAGISEFPATKTIIDKSKVDPMFAQLMDSISHASDSITFPDRILGQQTLGGELSNSTMDLVSGVDPETAMKKLEERAQPLRSK